MFTAGNLRQYPALVKAFTGVPAEEFWALVAEVAARWSGEQLQRRSRPGRRRAAGGGRRCARDLALRVALVLTYLRLPDPWAGQAGRERGQDLAQLARHRGLAGPE